MKEITLVVTEKRVFVPRDESKLVAQLGNLDYQKPNFAIQATQKQLLNLIFLQMYQMFDWDLEGRNRSVATKKYEYEYRHKSVKRTSTFGSVQILMQNHMTEL